MIIIAGTIDLDPEQREEALRSSRELIESTRGQPGCRAYDWSLDPEDPARIHVFELWSGQAELEAHFEGPYYKAMLASLGARGLRGADVAKYRVDATAPVYDGSGKARADFPDA